LYLEIERCPAISTQEVKRLVRIELDVELAEAPGLGVPWASIRCEGARAILTYDSAERRIDLAKVDPRAQPRLLALALAELAAPPKADPPPKEGAPKAPPPAPPKEGAPKAPPQAPRDDEGPSAPAQPNAPPSEGPASPPPKKPSEGGTQPKTPPTGDRPLQPAPKSPPSDGETSLAPKSPPSDGETSLAPKTPPSDGAASPATPRPPASVAPGDLPRVGADTPPPARSAAIAPAGGAAAEPPASRPLTGERAAAPPPPPAVAPATLHTTATATAGAPLDLHFAASVLGGLTLFTADGPPTFGARASIELAPSSFGARVDLGAYFGSESVAQGDVSLLLVGAGLTGFGRFGGSLFLFDIGAGARAGFARITGTPTDPSALAGATVSGAWAGPHLLARATLRLGALLLAAEIEGGLVIRPVVGRASGLPIAAADGAWFAFHLGVGLEP
jgi:hypothetical protein